MAKSPKPHLVYIHLRFNSTSSVSESACFDSFLASSFCQWRCRKGNTSSYSPRNGPHFSFRKWSWPSFSYLGLSCFLLSDSSLLRKLLIGIYPTVSLPSAIQPFKGTPETQWLWFFKLVTGINWFWFWYFCCCYSSDGLGKRGDQWVEFISWEPRAFVYHNFLVSF